MFDTMHYADFVPHVHTKFQLQHPVAGVLEIELINAEEFTVAPQQEQFTLTFLASPVPPLAQGLYQMEHTQLGTGALFLVPISLNENGLTCEAVFNRRQQVKQA